jgi:RHS repeat-associated protein
VTDNSGNVLGRQAHLPFGEDFGESGTQEKHHFTSYERDVESGSDYAVNRQYSQSTGRFIRVDPFSGSSQTGDAQSLNRYSYVQNDPISGFDPLGLLRVMCSTTISGSIWRYEGIVIGASVSVNSFCMIVGEAVMGKGEGSGLGADWIEKLIARLGQINDCEAELAKKSFLAAGIGGSTILVNILINARAIADKYERNHGGVQDDNPVNARKHCIWSCELSKQLDEASANTWTDAHECVSPGASPSASSSMDFHNNWIGRLLGTQASAQGTDCKQLCEGMAVTIGAGNAQDGSLWALRP